jgi:threonine/homoserine/homoserine lactone efflux protein
MFEILVFAFSVMYSPGPANMLALFAGVNNQGWRAFSYCVGVGTAMFILFLIIGYLGSEIIPPSYQRGIAIVGGLYIAYLGIKILKASFNVSAIKTKSTDLNFKTGLILQLCNPKSLVVIIPVTTVQFAQAGIEGGYMAIWCLLLAVMACGAPSLYLLMGARLKNAALKPRVMAWLNRVMAVLLLFIAYGFLFH